MNKLKLQNSCTKHVCKQGFNRYVSPVWHRDAFTLIELLIVITIISLLSSLLVAGVQRSQSMVEEKNCEQLMLMISEAISEYRTEYGFHPPMFNGTNNLGYNLNHPRPAMPKTKAERDFAKHSVGFPNDYLYGKLGSEYVNYTGIDWTTLDSASVFAQPIPIYDNFIVNETYGQPFIYVYNLAGRSLYAGSDFNYDVRVYCQRGFQKAAELWSAGMDQFYDTTYHLHDMSILDNKDNITVLPYK